MQTATKVARRDATAASGDSVAVLAFSGDIASTSKGHNAAGLPWCGRGQEGAS